MTVSIFFFFLCVTVPFSFLFRMMHTPLHSDPSLSFTRSLIRSFPFVCISNVPTWMDNPPVGSISWRVTWSRLIRVGG